MSGWLAALPGRTRVPGEVGSHELDRTGLAGRGPREPLDEDITPQPCGVVGLDELPAPQRSLLDFPLFKFSRRID